MSLTAEQIKYIIIHHSATPRDKTTFEAVKRYHISLGWGDIGYHFFITADGKVNKGREESTVGAHCLADKMNYKSLGICFAGDFTKENPSQQQINTFKLLLDYMVFRLAIDKKNILGHKEVKGASTACPGENMMKLIRAYRTL